MPALGLMRLSVLFEVKSQSLSRSRLMNRRQQSAGPIPVSTLLGLLQVLHNFARATYEGQEEQDDKDEKSHNAGKGKYAQQSSAVYSPEQDE